ncbi:MAG: peptide chain release factor N(5)-glutamine methyltransferase [Thermodesulfobacteriota bacterium]
MNLQDLYRQGVGALQGQEGEADAELDCLFFLSHLLDLPRAQLFLADHLPSAAQINAFNDFIRRRLHHEPLAYIIGEQEFWSRTFLVNPSVLIPRPETEILVEEVLAHIPHPLEFSGLILDLGTGSGILPVTLALELPQARFCAVDLSAAALKVAQQNCQGHGVAARVDLVQSRWQSGLRKAPLFDMIVSNPPYVDPDTYKDLQADVVDFEPQLALDGGERGRAVMASFCPGITSYLRPGGWFFMEIGYDQQEYATSLLQRDKQFTNISVRRDYAALARVVMARKRFEDE